MACDAPPLTCSGVQRVISLPEDVDPERVQAKYVDGIVQIGVQQRESARPRQIQIQ